ncbi:MAG TPA: GNAT family N-acetyltransferase, partial [Gammaproteobacteria bacterium]|nr:GNAT family N-acetyltransferase [Gammaproteobacteria bacterium]
MGEHYETRQEEYLISTDPAKLDPVAVHAFLTTAYWSPGIPLAVVKKALENSLCFGLYHQGKQVGLVRVVTDHATYGYLCDVYVLEAHRGKGLGHWMVECVMSHPELQNLRRFTLATK